MSLGTTLENKSQGDKKDILISKPKVNLKNFLPLFLRSLKANLFLLLIIVQFFQEIRALDASGDSPATYEPRGSGMDASRKFGLVLRVGLPTPALAW